MAQAQKPDFVLRRNTSPFKSAGVSVQSTTGSRGVRISGSNAGYTMFRGSVKGTGHPLDSPVTLHLPSRASPCAITFQSDSTALITQNRRKYNKLTRTKEMQLHFRWIYIFSSDTLTCGFSSLPSEFLCATTVRITDFDNEINYICTWSKTTMYLLH